MNTYWLRLKLWWMAFTRRITRKTKRLLSSKPKTVTYDIPVPQPSQGRTRRIRSGHWLRTQHFGTFSPCKPLRGQKMREWENYPPAFLNR